MLRQSALTAVANLVLFLGLSPALSVHAQGADDVLFVGGTVITGASEDAVLDGGWVWVQGDRIRGVGAGEPPRVEGAEVVDLQGKSILPGLADTHVHLRQLKSARWMMKALLAHGVTVILETGNSLGNIAAIRRWAEEDGLVPRYYAANSPLQGSTEDLRFLASGREVARAVANYAAFGIDFIKTYNFLSSEGLRQTVELASEHGIPVIGHTPLSGSSLTAFDAGLYIMQHLRLRPYEVLDDLELIARYPIDVPLMKRTGFWAHVEPDGRNLNRTLDLWEGRRDEFYVTPTLVAQEGVANAYGYPDAPEALEGRRGVEFVSRAVLESWRESSPPDRYGVLSPEERREAEASLAGMGTFVRLAHQRGIGLLAGSDTPVPWVVPGVSLQEELRHFVEMGGMTPADAIHTSTGRAAEALGATDRGLIEEGRLADLVIVDGDVSRDITALADLEHVVVSGRMHSHQELMEQVRHWAAQDAPEPDEEEEKDVPTTRRGGG